MEKYVLAIDEGTTSVRSIIFDKELNEVSSSKKEFKQIYPQPGFIEHNPEEIYTKQFETVTDVIFKAAISPEEIAAIGITNQRETTVVWNKNTGVPVYKAIVWQCRRTSYMCTELIEKGYTDMIKEKTGLIIDAYFSATKIKWILDNVKGARASAEKGELLFGTVDTYLLWKLTNGKVHATDYTNASRTMLFNIHTLCWDKELLNLFDIPESMLPEVKVSGDIFGYAEINGAKIPITAIAGDQQAALFGQGCFKKGDVKCTYGTGCFLLMNNGEDIPASEHGLITTVAANEKGKPVQYVIEGSVFVGGAVIQWLRDELGFINKSADCEYYASKVTETGNIYVVPAFTGLGAPYWDMYARGIIIGLTRDSGKNEIIRAALDSIAYQTNDLLQTIYEDTGVSVKKLKVDGGATENKLLMQFQADISDIEIIKTKYSETTAIGIAALAGLTCGFFANKTEISDLLKVLSKYKPNMPKEKRTKLIRGWKKAVLCASGWLDTEGTII